MRWITRIPLALVVAVACSSGSGLPASGPNLPQAPDDPQFPVRTEALRPSGATLPNGFRVAEGSWLLGTVFPDRIQTQEKNWFDWRALLALTGSVREVTQRYAQQARELGYRTKASDVLCETDEDGGSCSFKGRHDDSSAEDPVGFSVGSVKTPDSPSGFPAAFVQLQIAGAGNKERPEPIMPSDPDGEEAPLSDTGRLPSPGEPFTDLQFELDGAPLRPRVQLEVQPGSALVAPPYSMGGADPSGLLAVIALAADARQLVDAYTEHARSTYRGSSTGESWEWGDSVVVENGLMCRGACGIYDAKAVIGPDDSGYMLIRLMLRPG